MKCSHRNCKMRALRGRTTCLNHTKDPRIRAKQRKWRAKGGRGRSRAKSVKRLSYKERLLLLDAETRRIINITHNPSVVTETLKNFVKTASDEEFQKWLEQPKQSEAKQPDSKTPLVQAIPTEPDQPKPPEPEPPKLPIETAKHGDARTNPEGERELYWAGPSFPHEWVSVVLFNWRKQQVWEKSQREVDPRTLLGGPWYGGIR